MGHIAPPGGTYDANWQARDCTWNALVDDLLVGGVLAPTRPSFRQVVGAATASGTEALYETGIERITIRQTGASYVQGQVVTESLFENIAHVWRYYLQ